jgi:hypothetical protein
MSSDATPRMNLAVLPPTPAQPQVTHNEALHQIDALTDICLLGQFVNTPPASPADGDTYLLGGAPTGAWSGQSWKLAYCLDGGWRFFAPFNGLRATVAASCRLLVYLGGNWIDASTLVMPALPSFHAYKTSQSSDVTGDGTEYPMVFDAVDWDTGGNYSAGTGMFTAPVTGKYFFSATVLLLGVLSTHTSGYLRIQTGAGMSGVRMEINPSGYAAAGEGSLAGSCALKLNAGDTVKVIINVGGAGKVVDVYGAGLGSVMYTNFQGFLIAG